MEYVIAIKRVKDYFGDPLVESRDSWEYAQYGMLIKFPIKKACFGKESTATKFGSVEEALRWWNNNKKSFTSEYIDLENYDLSSLTIMRHVNYYEEISKNLSFDIR